MNIHQKWIKLRVLFSPRETQNMTLPSTFSSSVSNSDYWICLWWWWWINCCIARFWTQKLHFRIVVMKILHLYNCRDFAESYDTDSDGNNSKKKKNHVKFNMIAILRMLTNILLLSARYWEELRPDSPTYARFPNLLYTAELLCIKKIRCCHLM